MRKWTAAGCGMWIIGLVLFIVGLNLSRNTREWMTIAGSIVFLAGLGITGAKWMKTRFSTQEEDKNRAADQKRTAAPDHRKSTCFSNKGD